MARPRQVRVTSAESADEPSSRGYWLLKTEPGTFSFGDLLRSPGQTTGWSGIRSFQARNLMRDQMKTGDLAFIYHSSTDSPAVVGIAEIVRGSYPDPTAFDRGDPYFDPASRPDKPTWVQVDVRAVRPLARSVTLAAMRLNPALANMSLLKKGNRLSIQPVQPDEWAEVCRRGAGGEQDRGSD